MCFSGAPDPSPHSRASRPSRRVGPLDRSPRPADNIPLQPQPRHRRRPAHGDEHPRSHRPRTPRPSEPASPHPDPDPSNPAQPAAAQGPHDTPDGIFDAAQHGRYRNGARTALPPAATPADAALWGIDAHLDRSRWDPRYEPITVLGVVWDAASLAARIRRGVAAATAAGIPMFALGAPALTASHDFSRRLVALFACLRDLRLALALPLLMTLPGAYNGPAGMVQIFIDNGEALAARLLACFGSCEQAAAGATDTTRVRLAFLEALFGRGPGQYGYALESLMTQIRYFEDQYENLKRAARPS